MKYVQCKNCQAWFRDHEGSQMGQCRRKSPNPRWPSIPQDCGCCEGIAKMNDSKSRLKLNPINSGPNLQTEPRKPWPELKSGTTLVDHEEPK